MHHNIVIVGAGLSGLYLTWLLQQKGYKPLLIESKDRVGGRILSTADMSITAPTSPSLSKPSLTQKAGCDLGPTWFWPQFQPNINRLIQQLNLETFSQHTQGLRLYDDGQSVREMPSYHTEPESWRIAGGTSRLTEALSAKIPEDQLLLSHPLVHLKQRNLNAHSKVALTLKDANDKMITLSAEKVILTLPPRILAHSIDFEPALPPATLSAFKNTPTWMAAHAKVCVTYEKPFWRENGLSGQAFSHRGPLQEIHDACDSIANNSKTSAALFGFVGFNAQQRADIGEKALIEATINQLARLYGEQAGKPTSVFVKDWSTDRQVATPDDGNMLSNHPHYGFAPLLTDLWQQQLFFAGSEFSTHCGGYLEGAVNSALEVYHKLIK